MESLLAPQMCIRIIGTMGITVAVTMAVQGGWCPIGID